MLKETEAHADSILPPAAKPPHRLYSPKQICAAAFFGGPLAGAWTMRQNYVLLNSRRNARIVLISGVITAFVALSLEFALPDKIPNWLLPLTCSWGFYAFAQRGQGQAFRDHLKSGGERQSNWRVV